MNFTNQYRDQKCDKCGYPMSDAHRCGGTIPVAFTLGPIVGDGGNTIGRLRRCVKCGSAAVKVEYRQDWESLKHGEFLEMTCECGFEWHTPCLDAVP